ncbi:anti-repressor SinI family protein [Bacillus gaemokensis]|nr:anti-repressor SinI family protein [Bacillus gaemokensis]
MHTEQKEILDPEWIELMTEALDAGLSIIEIQKFLHKHNY